MIAREPPLPPPDARWLRLLGLFDGLAGLGAAGFGTVVLVAGGFAWPVAVGAIAGGVPLALGAGLLARAAAGRHAAAAEGFLLATMGSALLAVPGVAGIGRLAWGMARGWRVRTWLVPDGRLGLEDVPRLAAVSFPLILLAVNAVAWARRAAGRRRA